MDTAGARNQMITQQVRTADVSDPRVLEALEQVRREDFVPDRYRDLAFADTAIPLVHGQVMMSPSVEGRMLQALELSAEDRVLEIGTGTGFVTACIAHLAGDVTSVDIFDDFVETAAARLHRRKLRNVRVETADFSKMEPEQRYDAIAITGSIPMPDARIIEWLNPGGRLFVVIGKAPAMEATLVIRGNGPDWGQTGLFETVLPPLLNVIQPEPFEF